MNVMLAEEMGMCFGVRDALKVLDAIARPDEVTIHGELVHNEVILTQLGSRGFKMVGEKNRQALTDTRAVLITAHGISDRERSRLLAAGKELIDTTCPLVRRVHEAAARMHQEGYHVVLIGKAEHVEVRGIVEDLVHFDTVGSPAEARPYPSRRLAVICQTTVSPRAVAAIHSAVVTANPNAEIRFLDTTCQPTRQRQRSVEKLTPFVQAMVIVGGKNSNNTRELVELCRQRGLKSFHVQNAADLRPEWFTGISRVGVTAGTSTLDDTIQEVKDWLAQRRTLTDEQEHSQRWRRFFEDNGQRGLPIPWEKGAQLTDAERAVLIPSIQDFQLGESSDGVYGLSLASRYADRIDDPEYVAVVRLFFAEENRHADYLKRYLQLAGAPTIERSWTDFFFRRIRHLMRLETLIVVLLTAELIGKVFYRALRSASACPVLRTVCAQILRDEQRHLQFHIERLRLIRKSRSRLHRGIANWLHRVLFFGATLAVWRAHGRALRRGGYGMRRFWRETKAELREALRRIDGGSNCRRNNLQLSVSNSGRKPMAIAN